MPRMLRTIAVGLPHHVTQRGNGRRDIFRTDALRQTYLRLLRAQAEYHQLDILAYCLMTNHLHLVVVPRTESAMAGALRCVHGRFAQYWNTEFEGSGHMWENRYFSCVMQPARVWSVIRYVELNPVRAGIVENAVNYRWSSAAAHTGGYDHSRVLDLHWWRDTWGDGNWAEALQSREAGSGADAIRRSTYTGRPLGDSEFITGLEATFGRKLAPQRGGRPKKAVPPGTLAQGVGSTKI